MARTSVIVLGVILLALGILGFIPGLVTGGGMLFGVFQISLTFNIINIVAGVIGILFGARNHHAAKNFAKIFGVLYAFGAIVTLYFESSFFGLYPVNQVDIWFYIGMAVLLLAAGFFGEGAGHDLRHRKREDLEDRNEPERQPEQHSEPEHHEDNPYENDYE